MDYFGIIYYRGHNISTIVNDTNRMIQSKNVLTFEGCTILVKKKNMKQNAIICSYYNFIIINIKILMKNRENFLFLVALK